MLFGKILNSSYMKRKTHDLVSFLSVIVPKEDFPAITYTTTINILCIASKLLSPKLEFAQY